MSDISDLDDMYRVEAPGAVRFAFLITGDKALSEDLVQDAFLRVWDKVGGLDDPAAFGAYLRQTVVNLTRNYFRHEDVKRRYTEQHGHETPPGTTDTAKVQIRDATFKAMQQLPQRQREVLVCRYYLQLSEQETAETLDIPVGTVKSNTARAMTAMRETLKGWENQ